MLKVAYINPEKKPRRVLLYEKLMAKWSSFNRPDKLPPVLKPGTFKKQL
jgi:hypothetical protein